MAFKAADLRDHYSQESTSMMASWCYQRAEQLNFPIDSVVAGCSLKCLPLPFRCNLTCDQPVLLGCCPSTHLEVSG
eukprot:4519711-Amphidinium_carterae.1